MPERSRNDGKLVVVRPIINSFQFSTKGCTQLSFAFSLDSFWLDWSKSMSTVLRKVGMILIQVALWPFRFARCVWERRSLIFFVVRALVYFLRLSLQHRLRGRRGIFATTELWAQWTFRSFVESVAVEDQVFMVDSCTSLARTLLRRREWLSKTIQSRMPSRPFLKIHTEQVSVSHHKGHNVVVDWYYDTDSFSTSSFDGVILYCHGGAFVLDLTCAYLRFFSIFLGLAAKSGVKLAFAAPRYSRREQT
jgi:hypothetical protein